MVVIGEGLSIVVDLEEAPSERASGEHWRKIVAAVHKFAEEHTDWRAEASLDLIGLLVVKVPERGRIDQ